MQHQDRAAVVAQRGDVQCHALAGAAPVELLAPRLVVGQRFFHDRQDRLLADDLPELAADRGGRVELQKFRRPVVGELQPLLPVDGHHALNHPVQNGAQLPPVFLGLGELVGQPFAHGVKRAG